MISPDRWAGGSSPGLADRYPGIYISGWAIRGILFGVSPFDVPTLIVVAIGFATATLFACYLAARRVTALKPFQISQGTVTLSVPANSDSTVRGSGTDLGATLA